MTITLQIGNSDNKLDQEQWSMFVKAIKDRLDHSHIDIHFSGGSVNSAPWQNWCWVIDIDMYEYDILKSDILDIRIDFLQDSVSWTEGETKFI